MLTNMKTYAEYKRLAIKELTGEFPEETEAREKEYRLKYTEGYAVVNPSLHISTDLHLTINNLVMIDLGKLLNNK